MEGAPPAYVKAERFDPNGDPEKEYEFPWQGVPRGVKLCLGMKGVTAVELHYGDGESMEYSPL